MSNSRKDYYSSRRKENFYKQAKREQVRSRSYFKLEHLDKKHELIKDGLVVLDLGCAPGGWLEYLDKTMTVGKIIGIDLLEVKKQQEFSEKVTIIQGDFSELEQYLDTQVDLIISDMAPEFSGDSVLDRGKTHKLNIMTLDLAKTWLKKGGNLVFKSFEGEDLPFVRKIAKGAFESTHDFKPESSQKKSPEFFLVCKKKLI